MITFIVKRALQSLLVLLVVSFLTYMMIGLMPGDPVDLMVQANPYATPEDAARLKAIYGLDTPLHERYFLWLNDAVRVDFGYSRLYSVPVIDVMSRAVLNSVIIVGTSLALTLMIALPCGIYAAIRPQNFAGKVINNLCFAGMSIPQFWFALLLIILFSVTLNWVPSGGWPEQVSLSTSLPYMILPVLVLTLSSLAGYVRFVRAAFLEVLPEQYILTARAKGLSVFQILKNHAFRNASLPLVTLLAVDLGTLVSGALVIETLFSIPGMGYIIYHAVLNNDYNLALIAFMLITGFILIGNALADIAHGFLDPRVKIISGRAGERS